MSRDIMLEEKKVFLAWFLDRYQLKRRESMWILNYLLNHDIVLNHVHFVENAKETSRGILMSTIGDNREAFEFYKEGQLFDNPEQAFHEVRLNWHSPLYIELFFADAFKSEEYLAVLEDNPYYKWNETIPEETLKDAEKGLNFFLMNERRMNILFQIDKSLEGEDRDLFLSLSEELNNLEETKKRDRKFKEV